ncbi:MAG: hypothetical protein HY736_25755 [Verrucomicrobia bacterium]|nr:hypothetical protein [Verrucomicrobiota bacterium]
MNHRHLLRLVGCLVFGATGAQAQGVPDYERPPVNYSATTPHDAVAELGQRIAAGQLQLSGTARHMLRTLLRELNVPVESQIMVFSKTSLTRAAFDCRKMLVYQRALQTDLKETVTDEPTYDSVKSVFAHAVEDVLDRLLCRGEAPLPDGATGGEAFRRVFAQDAPRSRAGHALKDLRLRDHVFANRCSYLIYSDSFRRLPEPLKARIIARLGDVLRGRDAGDRYSYIGKEEKQRIYDILRETHPEIKLRWAGSKT